MALTLKPNIIANYRKLGKKPRIFIRIPSANIFIGTSPSQISTNNFTDSIAEFDTITKSIAKYGGMAEVSGFGVRNLQLGSRFTLCTEASISPQLGAYAGAGRLYAEGVADYSSARNSETASDIGSPAIVIGRRNIAGIPIYQVIRSYMQFAIPSGMTSCEEATIEMTGVNKQTYQAFTIRVALGTWSALGSSIFNDFTAWASSGPYLITDLNESWSTSEYSYGTTNKIRLNTAGKAQVLANTGSTLKLMLLSSLDVSNATAPSYDEYCQFSITGVVLKLRYNTITLDNKDAEVYLAYDDGTMPTSYSNMQLIWKGVVDDYSLNKTSLNLKLKQNDHKKNITVPKNIITIEDFVNCPDENLGEAYPLVYGDFSNVVSVQQHKDSIGKELSESPYSGVRDYIKGIVVNNGAFDQNNPIEIKLSEHVLKDVNNADAAAWLSNNGTFARIWGLVSVNTTNNTVNIIPKKMVNTSIVNSTSVLTYKNFGGVAVSVIPNSVYDSSGVDYPERAYSSSTFEYAELLNSPDFFELCLPPTGISGEIERVEIVFDLVDNNVGGGSDVKVSIRNNDDVIKIDGGNDGRFENYITPPYIGVLSYFTSVSKDFVSTGVLEGEYLYISSSINRGRYRIHSIDSAHQITIINGGKTITNTTKADFQVGEITTEITHFNCNGTGQRILDITDPASDGNILDWNIDKYLIRFTYNPLALVFNSFRIKNVQVRYYTSDVTKTNNYYFDSEGVYDIDGSLTGAGNTIIENPSHVIESFARDDMSLVTAELNTTAFDTAATALTSWKYAFQINDRNGARNFLHNFYRQCRSKGLWDEQDRLSIKTFSASNYFSVSGTDVPTGLDIFDTTGSPYLEQVTTNPIMDLEIAQIGIDEVINDFVLKYRKNYATGDYLETLYMTNGLGVVGDVETNLSDSNLEESQTVAALSALCASSYSKYETTNTLEFEADLIRDETTASMLLQYLIERMWKRRYMVTVTTLDTGARIEEGDFINIRDTRINDLFGETTANLKKWEVIRKTIDLNNMRYTFETIEVD